MTRNKTILSIAMIVMMVNLASGLQSHPIQATGTYEMETNSGMETRTIKFDGHSTPDIDHSPTTILTNPDLNSYERPRGSVVGRFHPDGQLRMFSGSGQVSGVNYTGGVGVSHIIEGGSYAFEGRYQFFNQSSLDSLIPVLAYDFDYDGVDEILASVLGHGPAFIGWNGTHYDQKWETVSSQINLDSSAVLEDVDYDGYPELVTGSTVYSFDGDYTTFVEDFSGQYSTSLSSTVGDVDNDGFVEILSYGQNTPYFHIYGWDGKQYVLETEASLQKLGYSDMHVVDLNQDGRNEIIAGTPNYAAPEYAVALISVGGNSVSSQNLTLTPYAHYETISGDFDADGFQEVLMASNSANTLIVEVAANGSIVVQELGFQGSDIVHLTSHDIDMDLMPEIITPNSAGTPLITQLYSAGATPETSHSPQSYYTPITEYQSARGVITGFIHPDGEMRVITGSLQIPDRNATVGVFTLNTSLGLDFETTYVFEVGTFFTPQLSHDFDGDGLEEILGYLEGFGLVFLGWDGTKYSPKWTHISDRLQGGYSADLFDIDRDGLLELITEGQPIAGIPSIAIYGWADNVEKMKLEAQLEGDKAMGSGIGDYDNDGRDEIISVTPNDPTIRAYSFDGSEYVLEYSAGFDSLGYSDVVITDFDHDGRNEMYVNTANVMGDSFHLTRFDWTGISLVGTTIDFDFPGKWGMVLGDFDADGFDEIHADGRIVDLNGTRDYLVQHPGFSTDIYHHVVDVDGDDIPEILSVSTGFALHKLYSSVTAYIDHSNSVKTYPLSLMPDVTPPSVSSPDDITYDVGTTGHVVSWEIGDMYPGSYKITLIDRAFVEVSRWENTTVSYSVDGLDVGHHYLVIEVTDLDGNLATDQVNVIVEDPTTSSSSPSSSTTPSSTSTTDPTSESSEETTQQVSLPGFKIFLVIPTVIIISKKRKYHG